MTELYGLLILFPLFVWPPIDVQPRMYLHQFYQVTKLKQKILMLILEK